jgi:hypothetical protein
MTKLIQWEYRIDEVGSFWKNTKPEDVEDYLNQLGEEGWEVVNLHSPQNSNKLWVTIKRPLTPTARRERSRSDFEW